MHIAELSQVDNYILTCDENGILTIPSNASHYLVGNKGSIFFFFPLGHTASMNFLTLSLQLQSSRKQYANCLVPCLWRQTHL